MVWQFIDVFKKVYGSNKVQDDDFADRMSHRYTVAILILFCILVGSSQFVGSPIACWAPAHFTGSMTTYTNYICWIANTYYVPTDETLPTPNEQRQFKINYYQWIPFILALMAFLFYSPFAVWHLLAKPSGLDAKSVMKIISSMDASSSDSRDKTMKNAVKLIDRAIDYHRDYYDQSCLGQLRRKITRCLLPRNKSGCYISALYMLIKLFYLANVCGQFFLLNAFMGPRFNIYGFEVVRDLWQGKDFWESPRFPRVTMCDFTIRTLGENNQRNTIQCALPINLFNEKIFIFIWFWLCLVAIFTSYSFLVWIFSFTSAARLSFVKRYLKVQERIGYLSNSTLNESKVLDAFLYEYLRHDGVFLLRIVKKNTNDIVVGELVSCLWDNFKKYPRFTIQNGDSQDVTLDKVNDIKMNQIYASNGDAHLLQNAYHINE